MHLKQGEQLPAAAVSLARQTNLLAVDGTQSWRDKAE
jgi:hypothetical protein